MPRRGESNHNASLTDEQVRDMRQLYASWKQARSNKGYGTLAEIFGCGQSTARDICTYRTRYAA